MFTTPGVNHMASTNSEGLDDDFIETIETQMRIRSASGVRDVSGDLRLNPKEQGSFEQTIGNDLVNSEKHPNTLAAINNLPIEIFTHIIHLANGIYNHQPYLLYTWVCSHWRSLLIQNPIFWTMVKFEGGHEDATIDPFIYELLRRSKTSWLDIEILISHETFPSEIGVIFSQEGYRIRRLWLEADGGCLVRLFSDESFPALQVVDFSGCGSGPVLLSLLPVVSDSLETLRCSLWDKTLVDVIHQLAHTFNRTKNLEITLYGPEILHSVFNCLHNNINLQNLQITTSAPVHTSVSLFKPANLPGLQFLSVNHPSLLDYIWAPKLSSLRINFHSDIMETIPEFNFSLINHLYLLDSGGVYSITGLQGHAHSGYLLPMKTRSFVENAQHVLSMEHITVGRSPPKITFLGGFSGRDTPEILRVYFQRESVGGRVKSPENWPA